MNVKKYVLSRVKSGDFVIIDTIKRNFVLRNGVVIENRGMFTSFKGHKLYYVFNPNHIINFPDNDQLFKDINIILTSLESPLLYEIKQLHRIKMWSTKYIGI